MRGRQGWSLLVCCAALAAFAPSAFGQFVPAAPGPARSANVPGAAPATAPSATPPAPSAAPQVPPPFRLSPQENANLDFVLREWERRGKEIKSFECKFKLYEYGGLFAATQPGQPHDPNAPTAIRDGALKYSAPDKGMYKVDGEGGEHWVTDGKSVFEFNAVKKELIEHRLPPELQGQAIVNGPIPFLFGAKADDLKRRYYLRVTTPADVKGQVWLEAYPKLRHDAAEYRKVDIILTEKTLTPDAVQMFLPNGKERKVHKFYNASVNSPWRWLTNDFTPSTPFGWKRVIDDSNVAATAAAEKTPPAPNVQAPNLGPSADPPAARPATTTPPAIRLTYSILVPVDYPAQMRLRHKDGTEAVDPNARATYAAAHREGWDECAANFAAGRLDPADTTALPTPRQEWSYTQEARQKGFLDCRLTLEKLTRQYGFEPVRAALTTPAAAAPVIPLRK